MWRFETTIKRHLSASARENPLVALLTALLGLSGIVGIFAVLYLAPSGLAETAAAIRPSLAREGSSPRKSRGLLKTAAALCLVVLPFISMAIAESLNNWFDPDGDGMLADTVNGSYDWVDINGGDFVRIWGLGSVLTLTALVLLLRIVDVERSGRDDRT